MDVPCPVPLQDAWSPVGYRVVEKNVPQTQPNPCTGDGPLPEPCIPSSPVGYRVVEVPRDQSAPPRRTAVPAARSSARLAKPVPVRKKPPVMLWGACAAGGAAVLIAMIAIIAVRMSTATPEPEHTEAGPVVLPQVIADVRHPVPVQEEAPAQVDPVPLDKPAPKPAPRPPVLRPPAPAMPDGPVNLAGIGPDPNDAGAPGADCNVCQQNFGTSVNFARNPVEANRQATEERKLTFILHVSGNFEEARFT